MDKWAHPETIIKIYLHFLEVVFEPLGRFLSMNHHQNVTEIKSDVIFFKVHVEHIFLRSGAHIFDVGNWNLNFHKFHLRVFQKRKATCSPDSMVIVWEISYRLAIDSRQRKVRTIMNMFSERINVIIDEMITSFA